MVTHDPRFAKHAQREVHLFDGKVVAEEELKKLLAEVQVHERCLFHDLRYAVAAASQEPGLHRGCGNHARARDRREHG